MSNIKFFEKIEGYPVVIPKKKCHADELRAFLERFECRKEVVSITVQLDESCDKKLVMVLEELGFIEDEKEHVYCCDLIAWNGVLAQFDETEYEFVPFGKCGISPFLDIAQNASKGDIYSFSEYFNALMEREYFDERLWEVLYFKRIPVGLVIAHIDSQNVGRIDYFAVIENFQNKGIGTILHMRGMGLLKAYGATKYVVEIDHSRESMVSVIRGINVRLEKIRSLYIK